MTVDQVKMMRDYSIKDDGSGNTMAFSLSAIFNNEITFSNTDHHVIYDDDNALIHCLQPNTDDVVNQAVAPYKINTGFYDNIQYMEALYTMKNFGTAVKELFLDKGLITQEQYTHIMTWASSIRNAVPDARPVYYKDNITPVPKVPERMPRKDGVEVVGTYGNYTSKTNVETAIINYIKDCGNTDLIVNDITSMRHIFASEDSDKLYDFLYDFVTTVSGNIENFQDACVFYLGGMPVEDAKYNGEDDEPFSTKLKKICNAAAQVEGARVTLWFKNNLSRVFVSIDVDASYLKIWARKTNNAIVTRMKAMLSKNSALVGNKKYSIVYDTSAENTVKVDFAVNEISISKLDEEAALIRDLIDSTGGTATINTVNNSSSYTSGGDDDAFNAFKLELFSALPVSNSANKSNFTIILERGSNMSLTYKFAVTYVAPDEVTVNSVSYHTLAQAIAAVAPGSVIELTTDVPMKDVAGFVIDKDLTINFGDKKIIAAGSGIKVTNATVELNGTTGGIEAGSGSDYVAVMASAGSNVTINGGKYDVGPDGSGAGNTTVYNTGDGNVIINGGTFSTQAAWKDKYYVLNTQNNATGTISVTGGTFVKYNPADGDDVIENTYVADGYISVDNGDDTFTVRVMTEDEKQVASEAKAEGTIDGFIAGLDIEGFEITETENNTYTITTNQLSFDQSGIIDHFLATENLTSIEVTDGEAVAILSNIGDEAAVAEFKAQVDAMIPDEDGTSAEIVFSLNF